MTYRPSKWHLHFQKRTVRGMPGPTNEHFARLVSRYERIYKVKAA